MALEDKLNLQEQLQIIRLAENSYWASGPGIARSEKYGDFAPINGPYVDLANTQGELIYLAITRPEALEPGILETIAKFSETILARGGSAAFDKEFEPHWLEYIERHVQPGLRIKLSHDAWENRINMGARMSLPAFYQALRLPDTEESGETGQATTEKSC